MTIRDVAREAAVGIKTVSRVVNDEPNVAPATAQRVHDAIARLNWEPDAIASNLRRTTTRTRSLGLLLGSVANPFAASIHRAIEDVASHRGVAVFASSFDEDPEREVSSVEAFLRRKVDGLILTPAAGSQSYLHDAVPHKVPVLFIDREPREFRADVVRSDNLGGAVRATNHLLGRGHRRIAGLFDRSDIWTSSERRRGFQEAARARGLTDEESVTVSGLDTAEAAHAAVLELFAAASPPTAIFSAQNDITVGVLHALRRLGLQREVAVIGFDDVELGDLMEPGVSVVAQRPGEIGRSAAERMFARLEAVRSDATIAPVDIVLPVDLIARGSGEIAPPAS
ncbi:LacI family DNA-binding transcriptional regulator [Microbacterium sp. SORGH_AS_0888]|uniref:LacI family DNA-binding transcriptional regulator n=1 Tax=Microbacterium sp. SORGH_AS_0888 TaxID=3041791 RepID=UPI0027D7BD65|nr:LacI family DNA-binding transcriptional regulator [Microbacterium sp. SORGH_AS_0888]